MIVPLNKVFLIQVWDLFYEADKVRAMLAKIIQEETLRTYLFTYSKVYDSISVVRISFGLTLKKLSDEFERTFVPGIQHRARNSRTHYAGSGYMILISLGLILHPIEMSLFSKGVFQVCL